MYQQRMPRLLEINVSTENERITKGSALLDNILVLNFIHIIPKFQMVSHKLNTPKYLVQASEIYSSLPHSLTYLITLATEKSY